MIQESTTTDGGLRRWTGLAVLVLAGGLLAFHAPDIGRRFGTGETNPGVYFGCFARSFSRSDSRRSTWDWSLSGSASSACRSG